MPSITDSWSCLPDGLIMKSAFVSFGFLPSHFSQSSGMEEHICNVLWMVVFSGEKKNLHEMQMQWEHTEIAPWHRLLWIKKLGMP